MRRFNLTEWFSDKGFLDGLMGKKRADESDTAEFPTRSCLLAYIEGYKMGERARTKKKAESTRE